MPTTSLVLWKPKPVSVFQARTTCGCPIKIVGLLGGEHPWYCNHPFGTGRAPARFKLIGNLAPHQVDGVVMPWASVGGIDMSTRWCDFSEAGDGQHLGRRFDSTHHFAIASRTPTGWHWVIFDIARADGHPQQLAAGDADKVVGVIDSVRSCELELAA